MCFVVFFLGYMLIGNDVKLNSPMSLVGQALVEILQYPERARDALRVLLHLVRLLQTLQCHFLYQFSISKFKIQKMNLDISSIKRQPICHKYYWKILNEHDFNHFNQKCGFYFLSEHPKINYCKDHKCEYWLNCFLQQLFYVI